MLAYLIVALCPYNQTSNIIQNDYHLLILHQYVHTTLTCSYQTNKLRVVDSQQQPRGGTIISVSILDDIGVPSISLQFLSFLRFLSPVANCQLLPLFAEKLYLTNRTLSAHLHGYLRVTVKYYSQPLQRNFVCAVAALHLAFRNL